MGESRYFTAYGAQPFGEPGRQQPARQHGGYAAEFQDDRLWPSHGAPDHDGFSPTWADGPQQPIHAHPRHPHPGSYGTQPPLTGYAPGHVPPGYQERDAVPRAAPPVTVSGIAQGVGAVLSLVLVLGGVVWTWQMMQRDVSGVPVVRALEGPLRVAPAEPGGMQAAYQGLSVNELASDGVSGLPEEIVLAPPPLELTDERTVPTGSAPRASQPERLIEIGLPLTNPQPDIGADPLGFVTPNRFAVSRSPRPAPRNGAPATNPSAMPQADRPQQTGAPADIALAAAVANSVASDLSRSGSVDVDPASIGPGTRLVQLGAYDSAAEARTAWDSLSQQFKPLLDDRGRVIEAAHSGGSVFYRLRAHGFSDERDARRFCAALIDQRLDCIPVLIR